ncbi:TPA: hypothetical protein N0F65_005792, partial [Lagenidium giganteum]
TEQPTAAAVENSLDQSSSTGKRRLRDKTAMVQCMSSRTRSRDTVEPVPNTTTPTRQVAPQVETEVPATDSVLAETKEEPVAMNPLLATLIKGERKVPASTFRLPFSEDEIKAIDARELVRVPPPYGKISKCVYKSKRLPVTDMPVHKCNCFDDYRAQEQEDKAKNVDDANGSRRRRPKEHVEPSPERSPLDSRMFCGENCHNRMLFISCTEDSCSAPDPNLCSNRSIQRRENKAVRVEYIPGPGFGLIADQHIAAGDFVIEYIGEVIDDKECERRLIHCRDLGETHFYMLELEKDIVIDARHRSNEARFINHSCDPNCMTQKWNVDGLIRIGIFARRNVLPNEEITIDYNFSHFGEAVVCKCGSSSCVGRIGLKRSEVPIVIGPQKATKVQEAEDAPPLEITRPVALSSLALLKTAQLDTEWLHLYGFKTRRLFFSHKKRGPEATNLALPRPESAESSSSTSLLSSEWSSSTEEDTATPRSNSFVPRDENGELNWYQMVLAGKHLSKMKTLHSYMCGGTSDWTKTLKECRRSDELQKKIFEMKGRATKKVKARRMNLLDARAAFYADIIAFTNGNSKWNKRIPSSRNVDPDRIYRFIENAKNGQQYLSRDLNDLNEDCCHRCGQAGQLVCCDGCPAAFHLSCTNLVSVPPENVPWFCTDCKKPRQTNINKDVAAESEQRSRRQLRTHAAPVMPSLKRIFHRTTKPETKRRPRKRTKQSDKSYRMLEHMPLPSWDEDDFADE